MDSTADTKQTDPHDVSPGLSTQEIELVARADERLAHAYEQIARADEQLARVNEQISKLEQDAARHSFDPKKPVNSSDPKKPVNRFRQPSRGRPALRGFIGLLLTAGICVAAFASQSYRETTGSMISRWAPQLILASSLPLEKPELAAQPGPPIVEADAALSQLPAPAQTAPQDVAPAAAPIPPELTQLLQTMARDLANVQQGIEQIKTSQEELASENARTAEKLKASQEQMARAIATAAEQNLRPRTSAALPAPIATPTRKPVSTLPPTQAGAQTRAPMQLRPGQQ